MAGHRRAPLCHAPYSPGVSQVHLAARICVMELPVIGKRSRCTGSGDCQSVSPTAKKRSIGGFYSGAINPFDVADDVQTDTILVAVVQTERLVHDGRRVTDDPCPPTDQQQMPDWMPRPARPAGP